MQLYSIGAIAREKRKVKKLGFSLKIDSDHNESVIDDGEIGELTLILDANLKIVDENWSVDVESPFVVATKPKEKAMPIFK